MKAKTCTFHCSACGSHFSSLAAFDSHRYGDHATRRGCLDPEEVLASDGEYRLCAHTGLCRLARGGPFAGVEIWTDLRSLERAREHFGAAA